MSRTYVSLTLDDAKPMLRAAEVTDDGFGIAYIIAVDDAGGHLVGFVRQDDALAASIDPAIGKAKTARLFGKTTSYLGELAQPGGPLFGIEQGSPGDMVIFGGGRPIQFGGAIVGAARASAGTIEQDVAVAEAAARAIDRGER